MKDSEVVEKAIEILDERGWCQEVANSQGQVCLGEALVQALSGLEARNDMYGMSWASRLEQDGATRFFSLARLIAPHSSIGSYNDYPGRTLPEIQEHLLTVAKDLRNEGK
jgi:hypothetical protein